MPRSFWDASKKATFLPPTILPLWSLLVIVAIRARQILGRNVNRLRMALGLTQEELADQSQIDRRQLQRIEAGTANPGVEMLARLRKALDCSWPDLLTGM
ncbi:MAG: helix-turn-helix transcriptional regulator [Verrucomicrobia bacterium]|nr:helix-turn-helix transcriptional regulator [Verrucomicrobiota bacterium]